jgi:hypothetical protein
MERIYALEINLLEGFVSFPSKRKNIFLLLFVDLENNLLCANTKRIQQSPD